MEDMYKATVIMLTVIITNYVFDTWTQIVSMSMAIGGAILAASVMYHIESKDII